MSARRRRKINPRREGARDAESSGLSGRAAAAAAAPAAGEVNCEPARLRRRLQQAANAAKMRSDPQRRSFITP